MQRLLLLGIVCLLLSSAVYIKFFTAPPSEEGDVVIAEVGGRKITLHDFRMNYEFGFPQLKEGKTAVERKRSYMNAMVNEMLLACEGYALGLDRSVRVESNDREMMTDLLTDALIDDEVVRSTTVSDEEIRRAVNTSKVQIKIRYWGESDRSEAEAVSAAMAVSGYAKVLDSILSRQKDQSLRPSMFESDYVNAFEVDPAVISAMKDLQIGEISKPVNVNGGYFVFQLMDIRRKAVMEHEYAAQYPTMKKVLLNMKYDEGISRFVASYMTAQNVVTKGEPFWALADAVAEWIERKDHERMPLSEAVKNAPDGGDDRYAVLKGMRDRPIVTYNGGTITVEEFVAMFRPSLRDMDPADMQTLRKLVNQQVKLTVRNKLMADEAVRRGLDERPSVIHDRSVWKNKSVYEEVRQLYTGNRSLTNDSAKKIKKVLEQKADSLRSVYPVIVHYDIIDTMTVQESNASKWMTVQLFKLGSKKMAVPMTDGLWGRF